MEQLTAVEAHQKVEQAALAADSNMREVKEIAIGKAVRQGDIYLHRVLTNHPHGKEAKSNQLAVGSDMNARHLAESPCRVYEGTKAPEGVTTPLLGPCIESDLPIHISHPEHARIMLPPGVYQVTFQMDARTLDRVRD